MAAAAAAGMPNCIDEFQRLQRKAMTSLDAVRDLHNNDERVFRNAFSAFSELWSYQQHHRWGAGCKAEVPNFLGKNKNSLCTVWGEYPKKEQEHAHG